MRRDLIKPVWETVHLLMFKLETVACCLTTFDIFISAT